MWQLKKLIKWHVKNVDKNKINYTGAYVQLVEV